MSVSKALRFQVLRRDRHTCRYCGRSAPEVKLVIDHVMPSTLGGPDEPSNLVTACTDCNGGKSATPPGASLVADVSADALRWAAARAVAGKQLAADRLRRDDLRSAFLDAWNRWTYRGTDGEHHTLDLPNDWPLTVDKFVQIGLTEEDLTDAVDVAMRTDKVKDVFKYFCGVAWGAARRLDDETRAVLDAVAADAGEEANLETRVGSCRIGCPHCDQPFEALIEIVGDRPGEPLKLRGEAVGDDPFDGASRPGRVPEPVGRALEDLFDAAPPDWDRVRHEGRDVGDSP